MRDACAVDVVEVRLPARWSQLHVVDGNGARQLHAWPSGARIERANDGSWSAALQDGTHHLIRERGHTPPGTQGLELARSLLDELPAPFDSNELRWVASERPSHPDDVRASLAGRFVLRTEDTAAGVAGLRIPQAGALHAILAHWSTGATEPATVVLPTGTGKTETMVALFAGERLPKVLVLVPSDNLRTQIAEAFETYGVLPKAGVLAPLLPGPVVGRIEHHFTKASAVRSFVDRCNVMVTTPDALNASSEELVNALIERCTHLFIDEAHHVAAKSWARIRDAFGDKPVLQFTATPYRKDGERLGGRVIYSFPLGRAQELGYFQPISYLSVVAFADPDRAVAEQAIARLKEDREEGLDHLIMARVNRIGRARDDVLPIYRELAPEFEPQILHSSLSAGERRAALEAINQRNSRVVVCVDMLGEGFNFPELKIAALHDPHRSLGVALQFIGRFARSRSDLGTATAVVARPEPGYDERLRALYAEGNQWDAVIETLATQAIDEVRELDTFEGGFGDADADGLSIHTLRPKMSTVVYETDCVEWRPERLRNLFTPEQIISAPAVNAGERVVWMVVEIRSAVRWARLQSAEDVAHHLHVLHWDKKRALLYINSSDLESHHQDLAEAVCGESASRITEEMVFRALGDLQRPTPTNVGVIDLRSGSRRFSMHVGSDVYEGFPVAEQQSKSNTNIFVVAFDKGERVTMGAARRGRIWSHQAAASVLHWVQWCRALGPKLQNDSLNLDALFRSFVRPKPLKERPALMPLAIDWPWMPISGMGESIRLRVGETAVHIIDVELAVTDPQEEGPIYFGVRADEVELPYEAVVEDERLVHRALGAEAYVIRERSDPEPLSEYLDREGTTIWFEKEVLIEGPSVRYDLERDQPPIDPDRLVTLDWDAVDIKRESQGPKREPHTVQARAAEHLIGLADWDVVIDDDDTGEVADLVALKDEGNRLLVHLVHCKFSSKREVSARLKDLYEVCGQAQRSAHHRQGIEAMVSNLIRRERNRQKKKVDGLDNVTGIMIGDDVTLLALQDIVRQRRPQFRVTIVQPGFSKKLAKPRHLELLGATDVYVAEIAYGSFDVWCSA